MSQLNEGGFLGGQSPGGWVSPKGSINPTNVSINVSQFLGPIPTTSTVNFEGREESKGGDYRIREQGPDDIMQRDRGHRDSQSASGGRKAKQKPDGPLFKPTNNIGKDRMILKQA